MDLRQQAERIVAGWSGELTVELSPFAANALQFAILVALCDVQAEQRRQDAATILDAVQIPIAIEDREALADLIDPAEAAGR